MILGASNVHCFVLFCFVCCSGLCFSSFHAALPCSKGNVKRRILGKRNFLVPRKQVKILRELEVLKNSLFDTEVTEET